MRIRATHLFFLVFTSTMISCGQSSRNQINITINEHELGLILTKKNRYVLDSGEHKIDKESKVMMFNRIDSLTMEEFDILDLNAKSLFCHVQIKYSLTATHIENITNLLGWVDIETYKKLLIAQEIKSEIRDVTSKYETIDLKKKDYKDTAQIKKSVGDRLKKYIDLISLELEISEKQ